MLNASHVHNEAVDGLHRLGLQVMCVRSVVNAPTCSRAFQRRPDRSLCTIAGVISLASRRRQVDGGITRYPSLVPVATWSRRYVLAGGVKRTAASNEIVFSPFRSMHPTTDPFDSQ